MFTNFLAGSQLGISYFLLSCAAVFSNTPHCLLSEKVEAQWGRVRITTLPGVFDPQQLLTPWSLLGKLSHAICTRQNQFSTTESAQTFGKSEFSELRSQFSNTLNAEMQMHASVCQMNHMHNSNASRRSKNEDNVLLGSKSTKIGPKIPIFQTSDQCGFAVQFVDFSWFLPTSNVKTKFRNPLDFIQNRSWDFQNYDFETYANCVSWIGDRNPSEIAATHRQLGKAILETTIVSRTRNLRLLSVNMLVSRASIVLGTWDLNELEQLDSR